MNVLFISSWGGSLGMAYRMKKEGHAVKLCNLAAKQSPRLGEGLVPLVASWENHAEWADLIVTDDMKMAHIAEELRDAGHVVWGGTKYTDKLELDRKFGQEEMKRAGLAILPCHEFSKLDEGIKFIQANPKRYVVKLDGPIQDEKALSYVGKKDDGYDMIKMLEQYKRWGSKITKFDLQDFVKGVEVGISGFFNGHDFVSPIEISFEHKKLMNDNMGPATGEMGTTMLWTGKDNRLYRDTIDKMTPVLAREGYVGYFDINCIAVGRDIWPLEITSRFGYPTIHLKMETIDEDLGELFYEIATGVDGKFQVSNPVGICVVLAMPPYPFASKDIAKKYTEDMIVLIDDPEKRGVWPAEIREEDGEWYIAGESGFTVVVSGQGHSIEEAQKQVYDRAEGVAISNLMMRTDVGHSWNEDMEKLRKWGWLSQSAASQTPGKGNQEPYSQSPAATQKKSSLSSSSS